MRHPRFRVLPPLIAAMSCAVADPAGLGTISATDTASTYVLVAPHGTYDRNTDSIVSETCQTLGWDCVIATGYRTDANPINVNRPTEGVGVAATEENFTSEASSVYQSFISKLDSVSPASELYVEIHGNSRSASSTRIEVAVVGVGADQAARIRKLIDSSLASAGIGSFTTVVEGADEIYFEATSTKTYGVLGRRSPALHFELPADLRKPGETSKTAAFLSSALSAIAAQEFP